MRIQILTVGDRETPSTYFRFHLYEEMLKAEGFDLRFVQKPALAASKAADWASADLIINQKCPISRWRGRHLFNAGRPLWFDFDDAIWTRPGKPYGMIKAWQLNRRLARWLSHADLVTVPNGYLADFARRHARRVEVVPMSVDVELWKPAEPGARTTTPEGAANSAITIGWAGSPVNLPYLQALEPVLAALLDSRPDVQLRVLCGKAPSLKVPHVHVPWQPGAEATFTQSLDIGLLPLLDEPYQHGKSPIKAVQYLACGVPVVGTLFGGAAEIVDATCGIDVRTPEAWVDALQHLIDRPAERLAMAHAARDRALAHHDLRTNGARLASLMRELGGKG